MKRVTDFYSVYIMNASTQIAFKGAYFQFHTLIYTSANNFTHLQSAHRVRNAVCFSRWVSNLLVYKDLHLD